jgi:hypothetical protein
MADVVSFVLRFLFRTLHGPTVCFLRKTTFGIGNPGHEGKHSSCRTTSDGVLRLISGPSRKTDTLMYTEEFPKCDSTHHRGQSYMFSVVKPFPHHIHSGVGPSSIICSSNQHNPLTPISQTLTIWRALSSTPGNRRNKLNGLCSILSPISLLHLKSASFGHDSNLKDSTTMTFASFSIVYPRTHLQAPANRSGAAQRGRLTR